jgi:hypothetical protein
MKAYWGVEIRSTHSLTSALDGIEWSASCPCRFTPQGKSPWYPLDRRLGGPQSPSGRGGDDYKLQFKLQVLWTAHCLTK